ncbi:hypothetical protein EON65_52880 [archaeon]|nr:MAG: hypothetical protein EON65_52880 [archaeon]
MYQSASPSVGKKDLDKTKKPVSNKPPRGPRLQAIKLDPELQPLLPRDAVIQEYPSALARGPQIGSVRPLCVAMYALTFLFAVTLCYGIVAFSQSISCLGAPYLYVTHKDSRNVVKFSRDGCLLHEKVLWGVSNAHSRLRSMVLGTYKGIARVWYDVWNVMVWRIA